MRQKKVLVTATILSFLFSIITSILVDLYLGKALLISNVGLQKNYNTGIAFGINLGPLQNILITGAIIFISITAYRTAVTLWQQIGFGLLLGGAYSNILDRILDGKVTDMLKVGSFPIFNIADTCINIGVALLIICSLTEKRQQK